MIETRAPVAGRRRRASEAVLVGVLVGMSVAAEVSVLVAPWIAVLLHAGIAVAAVHDPAVARARSRDADTAGEPIGGVLVALAVLNTARIVPFALPLSGVAAIAPALVACPMLAAVVSARRAGLASWRNDDVVRVGLQVLIALVGVPLSLLFFLSTRPVRLVGDDVVPTVVAAASLLLLGVVEELVYRGVVQRAFAATFGGVWAIATTAVLTAAAAIGYRSWTAVLAAAVIAVVFGVCARRTGRLIGVGLAHGLLLIGAFLVWPHVLPT